MYHYIIIGGDKYMARGILFKYAVDIEMRKGLWMYGTYDGHPHLTFVG